jgi:hypothetical protein
MLKGEVDKDQLNWHAAERVFFKYEVMFGLLKSIRKLRTEIHTLPEVKIAASVSIFTKIRTKQYS